MANLIDLSDGHMDILHGVVHRELQRLIAGDTRAGEEINYDRAAHLLTIYDRLSWVVSKWKGRQPQNPGPRERYREIAKGSRVYLAMDGSLRKIPSPD
jgi:hypothetical protein